MHCSTIGKPVSLALLALLSSSASAGCLTSITSTAIVEGTVKGLYIVAEPTTEHYVAIDSTTCTASEVSGAGTATLGANTKAVHYFAIGGTDKTMIAVLLAAQASQATVAFRLVPGAANPSGYTSVAYILSPSDI